MSASDLTLWIIIGVAMLLVILALAVVYGRMNRRNRDFDDGGDLFDQRYDDADDMFTTAENFAGIRIERGDEDEDLNGREPGPFSDTDEQDFDDVAPLRGTHDNNENVVPLRAPEPAEERATVRRIEPQVSREPRQVSAGDAGGDYDYGAVGTAFGSGGAMQGGRSGYGDDDVPYVAPFIRDYIEESERRQSHRLDELRDDMRRQLTSIREEQSSRLDLFLNSIERKITGAGAPLVLSDEDGASTRRRVDGLSSAIERLNDAIERQGERLSDLSRSMEHRMSEMAPVRSDLRSVHEDLLSFRRDVEQNTAAISQLRDQIDTMKEDFGRMERSFLERAQSDQAVTMRLSDVIRGTLDEDEYEFGAKLSNGSKVDCLIRLRGGRSSVAIDGGFPIETFNRLPSREAVRKNMPQAKAMEDEFRRTVLRAIFSCADRCISPGETADSAILFMPSEAAYTILHDRFPDLVRDSHRARVWLTSPSTLMGVLNLLHNVLPGEEEPAPQPVTPETFDEDTEGPFYAGPGESRQTRRGNDERAASIEQRLRRLREEEEALADELLRRREGARRYRSERRKESSDDFEARLERFSFDIEEGRDGLTFREDRDDDLR